MQLISPAEINYRKKIEEKLIEDEFLFRVTVAKVRQISEVGIELCNIEDEDGESAKGNEFTTENNYLTRHNPIAEVEGHFKQELVQSPTPLFLKRNLLKIKLNSQNREKQFTNAPSAIGMVPLPVVGPFFGTQNSTITLGLAWQNQVHGKQVGDLSHTGLSGPCYGGI